MKFVQEAFDTNWVAPLGQNVDAFEQEISNYVGVNYGLALTSGTAAIHLALKYLGVGTGDYVFCSSLTFAGSCYPIIYQNAIPVFIDSEPDTWNMSPIALEKAFVWAKKENKMPKAVIIVDLYGQSADYDELLPICRKYDVPVIEDAAEALGATYKGKKCGTFGDIGILSFNGNKIITTSGGGMAVSNDENAIQKMKFWSTQSREKVRHYEHTEIGYNYRLSNICAGIGRGQLVSLEDRIHAKKSIYESYSQYLRDLPITMMPISRNGEPNYWLTVIKIREDIDLIPETLIRALEQQDIESRPIWKPMHIQPVFRGCKYFSHKQDVSVELFLKGICLPSGVAMTTAQQEKVTNTIKSCTDLRKPLDHNLI
ncbi:DegT/DnrJ/EryC1/StrS family aminotransferase [Cohnella pontilimi]|nr:DegT/DnrJ/EryC1/StrS family aminotransferase [Cohnella pontilimi]